MVQEFWSKTPYAKVAKSGLDAYESPYTDNAAGYYPFDDGASPAVPVAVEAGKPFDPGKGPAAQKLFRDLIPAGCERVEKLDPARQEIAEDMGLIGRRQRIALPQQRTHAPVRALGQFRSHPRLQAGVQAVQHGAHRIPLRRPPPQLLRQDLRVQRLQASFTAPADPLSGLV